MMTFKFSTKSIERLNGVDKRLRNVACRALKISKIDFGIPPHGGKRSAEEQQALFKDGKSQLDGVSKKSYHQTGLALDIYAYADGKASWEPEHLAMVAAAMLQAAAEMGVNVEWGGLWKSFVDMPHFQIPED